LKVLFVSSGNYQGSGISPIVKSQGESLKKNGIDIDYFPVKGKGITGYLKNIPLLRKHIYNKNYDLIHAHYSLSGLLCILSITKTPVILSLMGSDVYGYYNKKGKPSLISYFFMILTQFTILFVRNIIIKSENLSRYILNKKKINIIPNGVDLEQFKPLPVNTCRQKLGLPLNEKIILFLANRYNPRKNFNLLKNAAALIENISFRIINPFPQAHKDIPEYINACDVIIITSYKEGSPNIVKEAMACNCPIVSTDVGDVNWVIGNIKGCYLTSFDPGDVAEKIKLALKSGNQTNGRERIIELGLDSDSVAKKIIDVYKKVLKR